MCWVDQELNLTNPRKDNQWMAEILKQTTIEPMLRTTKTIQAYILIIYILGHVYYKVKIH